jgi:hypothetical protein
MEVIFSFCNNEDNFFCHEKFERFLKTKSYTTIQSLHTVEIQFKRHFSGLLKIRQKFVSPSVLQKNSLLRAKFNSAYCFLFYTNFKNILLKRKKEEIYLMLAISNRTIDFEKKINKPMLVVL